MCLSSGLKRALAHFSMTMLAVRSCSCSAFRACICCNRIVFHCTLSLFVAAASISLATALDILLFMAAMVGFAFDSSAFILSSLAWS